MLLAFARHLVALAVLLPFAWRSIQGDLNRYWLYRWQLVRASLAGMVAFNLLVYVGLHSTTASNAQLLNSSIPVLVVVFGAVVCGQQIRARQSLGLLLSCGGVLTIVLQGNVAHLLTLQLSYGDLAILGAMVSFSLFTVWQRSFPSSLTRVGLLAVQLAIAVVVLLPFALWENAAGARSSWSGTAAAAMLYVGLAASLLANLLYMIGIVRVGPARAGLSIHLVPLYGALLSCLFLGETLEVHHALGMAAIGLGLVLSRAPARPVRPAARTRCQVQSARG